MLETIAPHYEDSVVFLAIDANLAPEAVERFGIVSVPDVLLLVGGEVVERLVGPRPARQYRAMIDRQLPGAGLAGNPTWGAPGPR